MEEGVGKREEKGCTRERRKRGENGSQGQKWEEGSGEEKENGEARAQDRQDNDHIPSSEERWASS